jgi:hypothetical protein
LRSVITVVGGAILKKEHFKNENDKKYQDYSGNLIIKELDYLLLSLIS